MLPYHRAAVALRRAKSVVVCGHVRPDGDAIGSVLGLTLALRALGIHAVPTLADDREPPRSYSFLPGFALFTRAGDLDVPDVFVALDTPVPDRLGVARELMEKSGTVVMLDHHPDARSYAEHVIADPSAAATGQLVWRLLDALGVAPSAEIAEPLYVALMTDTGRFAYDNTSPSALREAADMVDAGADPADAARHVYQERSGASLSLEALALSRLTVANEGHVAWTYLTDDDFVVTGVLPEEAEHLPDAIRVIGGIDVALLLREQGEEIRGNLRSKTGYDVGSVARSFGGGGHRAASGFSVSGSSLEAVVRDVLAMLPGGGAA